MNLDDMQKSFWASTSPDSGRPSPIMSDAQWQLKFSAMRKAATPTTRKRYGGLYSTDSGGHDARRYGAYIGSTNYQNYCSFINDALSAMRHGGRALCFYTYQIADLLRFETKRLQTRYIPEDEWWECWLEPSGATKNAAAKAATKTATSAVASSKKEAIR